MTALWLIGFLITLAYLFRPMEPKGKRSFDKWWREWLEPRYRSQLITQIFLALLWPLTIFATMAFLALIFSLGIIEQLRTERSQWTRSVENPAEGEVK